MPRPFSTSTLPRSLAFLALLATAAGTLGWAVPARAFTLWNDLRRSALLPGDQVTIRVENPHGPGIVNTILYRDGGVQDATMEAVADGPSTLEATVPGPAGGPRGYGFRLVQGGEVDLLAVRVPDGVTPGLADLTRVGTDPTGDEVFGRDHLDLVDCRVSRDDTRLYASLTNDGGGFPVGSGLTFFSYFLGITDPAASDPDTVFALIQTVDVPGIIEPGLYQINGTGLDDLVKIGEITATELPGQDTIVLSCLLADLEASAVFQQWYDPADPRLGVAGFTQRITLLGGAQEADRTEGGVWHLREVALQPGTNTLPTLADLTVPEPGSGDPATVTYADAEAHCPVVAELEITSPGGTETVPLRPQSLAYDSPVSYASVPDLPPLVDGTWTRIVARFSDDQNQLVEEQLTAVAVSDPRPGIQLHAAPNPFAGRTEFAFAMPRAGAAELAVYDLAGRRVATLISGTLPAGSHGATWDGRDDAGRAQPSGVYVYRLRTATQVAVQRVTLLR
jgi:hypothetical protein